MPDTETFYRHHRQDPDLPEFAAENAYSASRWGSTFPSGDPSRYECSECWGSGEVSGNSCEECEGAGYFECLAGYSCCYSAEDLIAYFRRHCPLKDDDRIVIFEGIRVGNGFDGEPLAVPTENVIWTTWGQIVREECENAI